MIKLYSDFELTRHNTFGIKVKCSKFIEVSNVEEFIPFIKSENLQNKKYYILGGGSNTLFSDDFDGLVIHPVISGIDIFAETENEIIVKAGSGVNWDDFVSYCVTNNWHGVENLSYIPGTVGAAPVQNIGAYGTEAKDSIYEVFAVDLKTGEKKIFNSVQCNFSYRDSIFKNQLKNQVLITHVSFKLSKKPCFKTDYAGVTEELKKFAEVNLLNIRTAIINIRKKKLPEPSVNGNAGSFFKNPVINDSELTKLKELFPEIVYYPFVENKYKVAAGWLIEKCGWKGKNIGNAGVHSNQALVIINLGQGTSKEIIYLSEKIIESVNEKFGILLEPEVNII